MWVYWICETCHRSGCYSVQRPIGHILTPMSLEQELELIAAPWRLLQENHEHELKIVPEETAVRMQKMRPAQWNFEPLTQTLS